MKERRGKSRAGVDSDTWQTKSHMVGREAFNSTGKHKTFEASGQTAVPPGLTSKSFCARGRDSGKEKFGVSLQN